MRRAYAFGRERVLKHVHTEPKSSASIAATGEKCGLGGGGTLVTTFATNYSSSLAPNATNEPRIMLTHRFVIEEVADSLWIA